MVDWNFPVPMVSDLFKNSTEKHMEGLLNVYEKVLSGTEIENGYDANKIK